MGGGGWHDARWYCCLQLARGMGGEGKCGRSHPPPARQASNSKKTSTSCRVTGRGTAPPRAHAGQLATAGHITVTYIQRGRSGFTECLPCTWATRIMMTGAKQNGPHRTHSLPQTHESEVYKSHSDTTRPTLTRNTTLAVARTCSRYAVRVHACEWARMRMASIVTGTSRLCSSRVVFCGCGVWVAAPPAALLNDQSHAAVVKSVGNRNPTDCRNTVYTVPH